MKAIVFGDMNAACEFSNSRGLVSIDTLNGDSIQSVFEDSLDEMPDGPKVVYTTGPKIDTSEAVSWVVVGPDHPYPLCSTDVFVVDPVRGAFLLLLQGV